MHPSDGSPSKEDDDSAMLHSRLDGLGGRDGVKVNGADSKLLDMLDDAVVTS